MPAGSVPTPEDVQDPIVMYVTRLCAYCHLAAALLSRRGLVFRVIDVTGDPAARRWLIETTGRRTVPQVFIRGRSIGGYRELSALARSGGLEALLQ